MGKSDYLTVGFLFMLLIILFPQEVNGSCSSDSNGIYTGGSGYCVDGSAGNLIIHYNQCITGDSSVIYQYHCEFDRGCVATAIYCGSGNTCKPTSNGGTCSTDVTTPYKSCSAESNGYYIADVGYCVNGTEGNLEINYNQCIPGSPNLINQYHCEFRTGCVATALYCGSGNTCKPTGPGGICSPGAINGTIPSDGDCDIGGTKCIGVDLMVCRENSSVHSWVLKEENSKVCCPPPKCILRDVCVDEGTIDQLKWLECQNGNWVPTESKCYDADQGKNLLVKGTAYSKNNSIDSRTDCCKVEYSDNTGDAVKHIPAGGGECTSTGKYLYEAICKDNIPDYSVVECINNCSDGKCISDEPDIPDVPVIPDEPDLDVPCVDSDRNSQFPDGRNLYEMGIVQYLNENTNYETQHDQDECLDSSSPEYQPTITYSADQTQIITYPNIRETFCVEGPDGLYPSRNYFTCPLGCENGACIGGEGDVDTDTLLSLTGCCTNPLSSPCTYTQGSECCTNYGNYLSEDQKRYTSTPGPGSQEDCISGSNYFFPWGDYTACWRMPDNKIDLCTQGCCCLGSQNSDGSTSVDAIVDYKINCWGDDKYWIGIPVLDGSSGESCTNAVCAEKLAKGDYEVIDENDINPGSAGSGNLDPTSAVDNPYAAKNEKDDCTP
jgi:hypothetical protein